MVSTTVSDDPHADTAEEALRDAYTEGPVAITPIVYAEIAADGQFENADALATFLSDMSIDVAQPSPEMLCRSGEAYGFLWVVLPNAHCLAGIA